MLKLKRAYDPASKSDGYRVLVDRLWPRGIKKADAEIDEWAKDLAPSNELRKEFGHDPAKWKLFRARYRGELRAARARLAALAHRAQLETVTLVYAARDEVHNNAVVVKDLISERARPAPARRRTGSAARRRRAASR